MRIANRFAAPILLTVLMTLVAGVQAASSSASFDPAPMISAVVPRTIEPSDRAQTVTILGQGFEDHLVLTVTTPEGRSIEYRDDQIQSLRESSFLVAVDFATAGSYALVVANRDGLTSDPFVVDVRREDKPPAPAINRILPDEITAGPETQALTIEGRGFEPDIWIVVTNPIGEEVVEAVVRDVTATSFTLNIRLDLAGDYDLVVTNRSGAISNIATIIVK